MTKLIKPVSVLFVCTGNICRSPTAEAVFRYQIAQKGLDNQFLADSAGTHGYHIGDPPDSRSIAAALKRGVDMKDLKARRFETADFERFDYILAMDRGHYAFLEGLSVSTQRGRLSHFLDYGGGRTVSRDVPDPYYGNLQGFEDVYEIIEKGCDRLIDELYRGRGPSN